MQSQYPLYPETVIVVVKGETLHNPLLVQLLLHPSSINDQESPVYPGYQTHWASNVLQTPLKLQSLVQWISSDQSEDANGDLQRQISLFIHSPLPVSWLQLFGQGTSVLKYWVSLYHSSSSWQPPKATITAPLPTTVAPSLGLSTFWAWSSVHQPEVISNVNVWL